MVRQVLLFILFFLPLVAFFVVCGYFGERHIARMRRERAHLTLESFVKEFEGTPYSREAIEAAYSDLSGFAGYPVLRRDTFKKLGFGDLDDVEMVQERCEKIGVEDIFNSPYTALFPLDTIDDYVRFLSEVMRQERDKAVSQAAGENALA